MIIGNSESNHLGAQGTFNLNPVLDSTVQANTRTYLVLSGGLVAKCSVVFEQRDAVLRRVEAHGARDGPQQIGESSQ